ncbi:birA, biotin-(acetyl-CoA-carboxylase) ligase [Opitutaceae bacterium TAV1]|nr:birA, biotin-(acetyl-CoA-carboxylase) ligase [Opitutaceae bacterium TAV1]
MKPAAIRRPELVILSALLEAEPGVVSGAHLARELGMSRVAVWQHMEKLREQGFTFESLHSKGYRITGRPAGLNLALLEACRHTGKTANGAATACAIHLLDEVDSTNDEAARRLSAGKPAPFVVMAHRQTKGRGRFGRVWHSETSGNLYCSFAFRPQVDPARMQSFTLWMGVSICEFIAHFCRTSPATAPGIKWPNDILFDGRKAGGILTEARMDADQIRDLVLGLGLNLRPPAGGWPAELADRAVALSEQTGHPVEVNRFAAALVERVLHAWDLFISGRYKPAFQSLWQEHDLLRGQHVAVLQGKQRIAGTAAGVDEEGCLLLTLADGGTARFRAGEVTLEKKKRGK